MKEWNQAWLNYHKIAEYKDAYFLENIYYNYEDAVIKNALCEIGNAIERMISIKCRISPYKKEMINTNSSGVVLFIDEDPSLGAEGYSIREEQGYIYVKANTSNGILYGTFELIRRIQLGEGLQGIALRQCPSNPLRMLNHWDNMDGSIERGYSGQSFFFAENHVLTGERVKDYARLVSSVGINAVVINNVNVKDAATKLITEEYFEPLREMQKIFSGYGIRLFLSLNYAAVMDIGGLNTADPMDPSVIAWWKERMKLVYENLPGLGGFLVKADSEGRPGPFTYNRTQADGANLLADAIKPYDGIIIWRCFVYNCKQDWRDRKTDRAKASYDNFMPLDGEFHENVILQIKNGPMDFQVREPISPLFGGLKQTNMMLEVQIAQEYTGQQKHVCYLLPMFREILKFQTYAGENATIENIISGKFYHNRYCGIAAVANTGSDENWTGHDLAAANLYGFGRLSFDTELDVEKIAGEWINMTFEHGTELMDVIQPLLMKSHSTYEKYTAPLGIGWMVNPGHHYGPNVDGYEYDRWGTYHRADHMGIGVDRTSRGTGYTGQYNEPLASMYDSIDTCPEELLLFFHYVPYQYQLTSGKTLIQHIYDTHFEGVTEVESMLEQWEHCRGKMAEDIYQRVYDRLLLQLTSAREWRDVINSYFYRKSGIPDENGRTIY